MKPIRFLHLIKTGGTTIAAHLAKHLAGYRDIDLPRYNTSGEERFVAGHALRYHPDYLNMSIVRDPADWLVSVYHHDMARAGKSIDFETWYETPGVNSVDRVGATRDRMSAWAMDMFIITHVFDDLTEMYKNLWLLGLTENLDQDLPALFEYLEVPRKYGRARVAGKMDPLDGVLIRKTYTLTPEMRERIRRENPRDYSLYNFCRMALYRPWAEILKNHI